MKNIPKICHLIWTRNSPMSMIQVFTVKTFHKQNPDWEIIVHLIRQEPKDLAKNRYVPDYKGVDYFPLIRDMDYVKIADINLIKEKIHRDKCGIQISDILRERLVYKYGGVYSDFDMLWLRPMSEFKYVNCIGDPEDFEATVCYHRFTEGHHNNSNFVAEAGSKYVLSIINMQNTLKRPYGHQAFNTNLLNKMYPTFDTISSKFPRVIAIKYNTFYPYSIFNLHQLYKDDDLRPIQEEGVMGVHWFNGHELSHDYTMNNGIERACSMTSIIKREGLI